MVNGILRADVALELNRIVKIMHENPKLIIELGSHTDCRSTDIFNLTLYQKKAKATSDYIISKGIPKVNIYGKGYGEKKS